MVNPRVRMAIQADTKAPVVEITSELRRVGGQLLVPGVACPSRMWRFVDQVPIHVNNYHLEWGRPFPEFVYQLEVAILRVRIISTPPVPQGPSGEDRLFPGESVERLQRRFVGMAVAKKVSVDTMAWAAGCNKAILE